MSFLLNELIICRPTLKLDVSSRYVSGSKSGTDMSIVRTRIITLLVIKSESFFPTFDSSGPLTFSYIYSLASGNGATLLVFFGTIS